MMRGPFIAALFALSTSAFAQVREAVVMGTVASRQGSVSAAIGYNWELWKSKRFAVGTGLRFTSYFGASQYYQTAPAKLTSGSTGPLVIFKDNLDANIDTFLIQSPQANFLNLFVNLRYRILPKLHVGFNIDVIGFSFGKSKPGNYINRSESPSGLIENGHPTAFNVLLISDNDRGSLNSELYVRYYVSQAWAITAAASFIFTEYTTDSPIQQNPEPNDRFRNKSLMMGFGVLHKF
jgi:hypothetical protein